jgi:hypothetical protein
MISKNELKEGSIVLYENEGTYDEQGMLNVVMSLEIITKLNDLTFDTNDRTNLKRYRILKIKYGKLERYEEYSFDKIVEELK